MLFLLRQIRTHIDWSSTAKRQIMICHILHLCTKPKINKFCFLSGSIKQDIFKFEVTMDNIYWMQVFDRGCYLFKYVFHFWFVTDPLTWQFSNILVQIASVDMLDHNWNFVTRVNCIIKFHYPRMLKLAQDINFSLQCINSSSVWG